MQICPTTGKHGWVARGDAIATLKRINEVCGGDSQMETYSCRFCARWHLGHGYRRALARIVRGLGGPKHQQRVLLNELLATLNP